MLDWTGVEWSGWMDTPQTVTTTRAPAVLKTVQSGEIWEYVSILGEDIKPVKDSAH